MAQEHYTRTNQKVLFAGVALENWRRHLDGAAFNQQALVQAEREACLFHLYGAVLALCHEVAGYYRMSAMSAPRVEDYLDAAILAHEPNPELAELHELALSEQTWLAQLLGAHAALYTPPQAEKSGKVDPALPLIAAVQLDANEPVLEVEELERWRDALKKLILRFREGLSEC